MTGLNMEVDVDSEDDNITNMDQDLDNGPKNGFVEGSEDRARLVL